MIKGYLTKIKNKGYDVNFYPDDGLLRFRCQFCHKLFLYKRGRVKNPTKTDVFKWLGKFQCPYCGKKREMII